MENDGLAEQARELRSGINELNLAIIALSNRIALSEELANRLKLIVRGLIASFICGIIVVGYLIAEKVGDDRYVKCQAHFNEISSIRDRIINEVSDDERKAERARSSALDATFLDPSLLKPVDKRTPADTKRVIDLFIAYREAAERLRIEEKKADEARAANPIPPLPSDLCG